MGGPGNDVLMGGRGNDVLVGGPGADRLVCGPGRDVARADARDRVAPDCEVVRGLPPPALAGTYCGATSQGMSFCLDVERTTFGPTVTGIRLDVQAACEPTRQLAFTYRLTTRSGVIRSGAFASEISFPGLEATVAGSFGPARVARGTMRVRAEATRAGVDYVCDSGHVAWTAATPPPAPAAQEGRFCGLTDQQLELCLDVSGTPKTVSNLVLVVRFACTPPATLGISSSVPTAYAIRADGSFAFERIGTGETAGGGSFTVTHFVRGSFDAGGAASSGTLRASLDYLAPGGTRYVCDAGEIAWSAQRQ